MAIVCEEDLLGLVCNPIQLVLNYDVIAPLTFDFTINHIGQVKDLVPFWICLVQDCLFSDQIEVLLRQGLICSFGLSLVFGLLVLNLDHIGIQFLLVLLLQLLAFGLDVVLALAVDTS